MGATPILGLEKGSFGYEEITRVRRIKREIKRVERLRVKWWETSSLSKTVTIRRRGS